MVRAFLLSVLLLASPVALSATNSAVPADACSTIGEEQADMDAASLAGVQFQGYTFKREAVQALITALNTAQGATVPRPPERSDTTRIMVSQTHTIMALHRTGDASVLLLFYGFDGCRFAQGTIEVATWEDAMCIGAFIDCRPGLPI